jgi:periplasmic copper chaperone A
MILLTNRKIIMTNLYRFGGLLAALVMSASVYAGDIQVENAWARATAPGQDAAGVDLTITSKQAATLIGVSSPASKTVELHSMTMTHDSGMMKMREVEAIELPAGKTVNLRDSGYHLMLTGLKAPLKAGEAVPLTLDIKVAKRMVKIETKAEVRPLTATNSATDQGQSGGY